MVGNISRIMTSHCVTSTLCSDNWDSVFCLDDYLKEELLVWKDNMVNINSGNCFVSKDPSYFVYSDASAIGDGAFIKFNNDFVCHKMWSESESIQSSTQYFASVLQESHVKWFTDRQAAAKIVGKGSMKLDLHKMARRIFNICIRSGNYLEVQWIPRSVNREADYIRRLIDTDDWQFSNEYFLFLEGRWGTHSVGCFANYYNHKLPRYFSRFWNPNTSGIDFFFQPHQGENCLVVPPVSIVPRVLHYRVYMPLVRLLFPFGLRRISGH